MSTDPHSVMSDSRRAARTPRRIAAHAQLEARAILTNGEQLMVSLMLPAMVLLGLRFVPVSPALFGGKSPSMTDAVAATAVTAIIATSLTSQAIATGFDRRNGVLRWIATTPLGRGGYMLGKLGAMAIVHILQIVALGALSFALGWRPTAGEILWSIPVWILATCAFGGLGLLIAGTDFPRHSTLSSQCCRRPLQRAHSARRFQGTHPPSPRSGSSPCGPRSLGV